MQGSMEEAERKREENSIFSFNANHLAFAGLCSILVFLLRAGDSYNLQPVWRKRIESQHFLNREFPGEDERLPAPIITDLESDGINEVVLLTPDLQLTVLALPESGLEGQEHRGPRALPHVVIKKRASLPFPNPTEDNAIRPVVMVTGYLEPYKSMVQVRKQVIVIVTSHWQVLCYDAELTLLWQQSLMTGINMDAYKVSAMTARIIPHSIRKGDSGIIIVGGSFIHRNHQRNLTAIFEEEGRGNRTIDDDIQAHFSTFALSGSNGTVCWHHLPGDFGEVKQDVKHTAEHHWKLGLRKNALHAGEVPWQVYKDKMQEFMPHLWLTLRDTKMTLARFQRQSRPGVQEEDELEMSGGLGPGGALRPEHLVGFAYGGHRPHTHDDHIANPNALVIHHDRGIEVLRLQTGRPITRMHIPPDSSLYLDLDGDGMVERVVWGQFEGYTGCYLDVWRLVPIREKLEQISVCRTQRLVWTRSWSLEEDYYKKVPPYVTTSVAKKSGWWRHLLGHHLNEVKGYDLVVYSSVGRVTSIDIEGNIHWQAQTMSSWQDIAQDVRRIQPGESRWSPEFHKSFYPNQVPMAIPVYGTKEALAVVGWKGLAIIDLTRGDVLAEHSIPAPPTAPLTVGDFDNDGLNDIILTCKLGYIGFTVKQQANHIYSALYATAVCLSIICVTYCLRQVDVLDHEEEEEED